MKKYNYRMTFDANREYDYYCYRLFITEYLPKFILYFSKLNTNQVVRTWLLFQAVYNNGDYCYITFNDNILAKIPLTSSEMTVFANLVMRFFASYNLGQVYAYDNRIFINCSLRDLKDAYLEEAQRFYHYDTPKDELKRDLENFRQNNKTYLERKRQKK